MFALEAFGESEAVAILRYGIAQKKKRVVAMRYVLRAAKEA
jgi:hypothetical protein